MFTKTLTAAALMIAFGASAVHADDVRWYYDEVGDLYYVDDGVAYYEDGTYYYDDKHAKRPKDTVIYYVPAPRTRSVVSSVSTGPFGSSVIAQSGAGNSAVISQSTGGLFFGRQPSVSIDSPAGSIRLGSQPKSFWRW